ncbi:MAG: PhnB protein [Mycobacteriales bacterium]
MARLRRGGVWLRAIFRSLNNVAMTNEFPGVTPQLTVADAASAVRFYQAAFGADELLRNAAPDGRIMHCELLINGSRLLLHDDFDQSWGAAPTALGGTTVTLHMYVPDVEAAFTTAIAAGATEVKPPADAFWGDRYAVVRDPFGHFWSLATPREELSIADLEERADRWAAGETA